MEATGKIVNGAVVFDNGASFPEGCRVRVLELIHERTLGEELLQFSGILKGMPPDFSLNHDHYIHGVPKKY